MREDVENSACCKIPNTNREFWVSKIRRNQERDQHNYNVLQENGWQVIVIWECQLKRSKMEQTMLRVEQLINSNLIAIYKKPPIPYSSSEENSMHIAAEDKS